MREFTTAANAVAEETQDGEKGMPFVVDGVECRAFKPADGQLAVLIATTSKHSSTQEQVAGLINFFVAVLDDDSHSYIVSRLLDRRDPFGITEVQDIMEWMVEEWSGRPTKSPSVSTQSPGSTGPSSTRPTPALTSFGSEPTGS